ncbi:hypothetical protein GJU39_07525 [Pedobacter petrophilus]|uniref:Uncharacterized protein n=1 Tax=Pedobacter petrophilus TaxID=1908241 RepID=A0A7K0FWF7_9SPHI|nr:hypothetical protein [Pedobacter petrophilus]MRX75937.1 hypothetical protein [Pedobacter petrophilus]
MGFFDMIELEYFLSHAEDEVLMYQVIQFSPDDPWRVVLDGELLGSLDKVEGQWMQISGKDFSSKFFKDIVGFIDKQYFNDLPAALMSRWNKQIHEVLPRSDQEYLVVCKDGIGFKSFEGIFSRFVSGLLKDEWPINFRVFSHDFSEDFTLLAKPAQSKKNTVGWD